MEKKMVLKELLNAIHDTLKWVLHVVLIPVIAALKGITTVTTHVTTELEKV